MAKKILSVGFEVPGGEVEDVDLLSRQSLLDADVIIFSPEVPYTYENDTYLGKTCLSDDSSFRARDALSHWRRELAAAVEAGKLVVVFLSSPETVYVATGEKQYSGTGKNARATRIVTELHAYEALPVGWQAREASGAEMSLMGEARFLAPYWAEFAKYSRYEVFLEGEIKHPLVKTKAGSRVVAAYARKGNGILLALPTLDLDDQPFLETRKAGTSEESSWTTQAVTFGRKLVASLLSIADAMASDSAATPAPDWAQDDSYRLAEEARIEGEIQSATQQVMALESQRRLLDEKLEMAGQLRRLIYEQGKPLEQAVLHALGLLGFRAHGFREDGSEFDAVFDSPEGRFIGEVEGKDNKAINIDKFSQLERNLNEDFAREGVDEFAKGVLFGNAYRLKPPRDRGTPFTEKCRTAALRLGVALVHTPDLFIACRYLKDVRDVAYATLCRQALLSTSGALVVFPSPPIPEESSDAVAIADPGTTVPSAAEGEIR